ncbi:GAF domain-containing protein [Candidatus Reidiella endopervernicosa]|uniref:GAF domain-containing protein n=1 Tax=Candidatus Reidiella endopervernicosa TaxID=2738883 RepID=UPI001F2FE606|nr:GAF domain-containing protein [Candidatus Reidiella endopervernicosa]
MGAGYRLGRDEGVDPSVLRGFIIDIDERKRAEEAIRDLASSMASATGRELFEEMVLYLTRTLNVEYALIGAIEDENDQQVKVLSVSRKSELVEPFNYVLADTPCENVRREGICSYASGVAQQFPNDLLLTEMGIEGYVGVPIRNKGGRTMGLVVLLDTKPLLSVEIAKPTLAICADRISAEMVRMETEEQLKVPRSWLRSPVEPRVSFWPT